MEVSLRPVAEKDIRKIFDWRNHPDVRKMMFNDRLLTIQEHEAFWKKRLASKPMLVWMVVADGKDAGVARLDKKEDSYEVDILVDPSMQGKGIGTASLELLVKKAKESGAMKLSARVKPENDASKGIFKRNGFVEKYSYYERDA